MKLITNTIYCMNLSRKLESYVLAPVYGLAPNHISLEAFEAIRKLYMDILKLDKNTILKNISYLCEKEKHRWRCAGRTATNRKTLFSVNRCPFPKDCTPWIRALIVFKEEKFLLR